MKRRRSFARSVEVKTKIEDRDANAHASAGTDAEKTLLRTALERASARATGCERMSTSERSKPRQTSRRETRQHKHKNAGEEAREASRPRGARVGAQRGTIRHLACPRMPILACSARTRADGRAPRTEVGQNHPQGGAHGGSPDGLPPCAKQSPRAKAPRTFPPIRVPRETHCESTPPRTSRE